MKLLSSKDPSEIIPVTFDFSKVLTSADTNSTATVGATVAKGTDATPAAILLGSASIVGLVVTQLITGGVGDVTYKLKLTIVTGAGKQYVAGAHLPVETV